MTIFKKYKTEDTPVAYREKSPEPVRNKSIFRGPINHNFFKAAADLNKGPIMYQKQKELPVQVVKEPDSPKFVEAPYSF